jgi:hypothetical protein
LVHGKSEKADQARLSALNNYINAVAKLIAENDIENSHINQGLKDQIAEYNKLEKKIEDNKDKEETNQEKITKARKDAVDKYTQAEQRANDSLSAGLIDQLEHTRQLAAARAQEYSDLETIVTQYKLTTGETVRIRDETAAIVKNNQDGAAAMERIKARFEQINAEAEALKQAEEEREAILNEQEDTLKQQAIDRAVEAGQTDLAIQLENELIEIQRGRERAALKASLEKMKASDEETALILANFDKITEGMKQIQAEAKKTKFFDSDTYKAAMQIGEQTLNAFSSIASAMTGIVRQQAQEQAAEIDRMLEKTMENLQRMREEALIAEGFMEATTSEGMQTRIDAAIEANDEVLQYELERRQREMEINEDYDRQEKDAKEQAEREKAEIEYQAAVTAWELELATALANLPMMVMNAYSRGLEIPFAGITLAPIFAGLAAAMGGTQITAISASKPKMPKFADGGIVPGQPHGNTDTVMSMLTPGEVILNEAQQKTLAPKLGGDLTVDIFIDTELLGKTIVNDYINKGRILISASRGIVR